jgi:micrococcal nuclease
VHAVPIRSRTPDRRERPAAAWLLILTVLVAACGGRSAPPAGAATVVRVVDGDTVVLHIGDRDETVRLLGIDTPETVKPGAPVECYGPEASSHLKQLLPHGTAVRVERDVEVRDRFGRLLLYLFRVRDGAFVNELQVSGGYARPLHIAPNRARAPAIDEAAGTARRDHRGLWEACDAPG